MEKLIKSGFKMIDGARIYYEIHGKGIPLILLHGGMGLDSSYFKVPGILSLTNSGIQVVMYDQRGNGKSSTGDKDMLSHETWVKDLTKLLRLLGIEKYSVLGHSYGGWIALEHAVRGPERLEKLILVSAHAGPVDCSEISVMKSQNELIEHGKKVWPRSFYGDDKHWDIFERIEQSHIAFNQAYQKEAPKYDVRNLLKKVKADVLMIVGEEEESIIKRNREMQKRINQSRLKICSKCKHYAFIERPKLFTSVVREFLL